MSRCEFTLNSAFGEAILEADTARDMELKAPCAGHNDLLAARVTGATHSSDVSRTVDSVRDCLNGIQPRV